LGLKKAKQKLELILGQNLVSAELQYKTSWVRVATAQLHVNRLDSFPVKIFS